MNKDIQLSKSLFTRRQRIERIVEEQGKVDIDQLAEQLNVSTMTIRRDLMALEEQQKVIRTHGGAVAPSSLIGETPYEQKQTTNHLEKLVIASKGAELVPEGATIIVDSGTTSLELVRQLKDRDDVTILTNDIVIAYELVNGAPRCIVVGGELQKGIGAMLGPQTTEMLRQFHVDIFFLGAHAVDQKAGVTAPTLEKAAIKQRMIEAAETTWLLADSSKFHKKAFATVCSLTRLEGIITDEGLSGTLEGTLHRNMVFVPKR